MYLETNSIKLYYEIHGEGDPIILLHGNNEDLHIFDVLVDQLAKTHKVYTVDSRNHGLSSVQKELNYADMADDIISFIYALKLHKTIIYGFSDGGIIALLIAIKEKLLLSKIIISGANIDPSGIKKHFFIPLYLLYFVTRNKKIKLMLKQPKITVEDLKTIEIPAILLAGSNDFVYEKHTRKIAENIAKSKLEILENETHSSYVVNNPRLYTIIQKYL